MAKDHFSCFCQNCAGSSARKWSAGRDLAIEGRIELPRLARLTAEDREFIELFVLSAGSLKEVGKVLKLSYPTVRARLDRVIANLQELDRSRQAVRLEIIRRLERGELTAEQAANELARY